MEIITILNHMNHMKRILWGRGGDEDHPTQGRTLPMKSFGQKVEVYKCK